MRKDEVPQITTSDLLEALQAALTKLPDGPKAVTVAELAEAWQHSDIYVRDRLKALLRNGSWERVEVWRIGELDGRRYRTHAFRPKE